MKTFNRALGLFAILASSLGCSRGGGGGAAATGATVTAALLVTDAPADDFSVFEITIEKVQTLLSDGSVSENVLPRPFSVNLLEHYGSFRLLGSFQFRQGATGVQVTISPIVNALDEEGNPLAVQATSTVASDSFAAPLDAAANVAIEFPLDEETLEPSPSGGYEYAPAISLVEGEPSCHLEDLRGRVIAEAPLNSSFLIAIRDGDGDDEFGTALVLADASTMLSGPDGALFANPAAFFLALETGNVVEVEGPMKADGTILATAVQIEDPLVVAKIRGTIVDLDQAGGTLQLRIHRIAKGKAIVLPVLEALGNPHEIAVSYDAATVVFLYGPGGGPVGSQGLAVGEFVTARFTAFAAPPPFYAKAVVIHGGGPIYFAQILDVSGLPSSIQVQLSAKHPLVKKGILQQQATVDLTGPGPLVFLGIPWIFPLNPNDLLAGQEIFIRGPVSGAALNTIDALAIRVRPGYLKGTVLSEDPLSKSFVASYTSILVPFGGATANPVTVSLHTPAILLGKFGGLLPPFLFFLQMQPGDVVKVRGIGKADGSVEGYKVRL